MTEQQAEKLCSACVVIGDAVTAATQITKDMTAALNALMEKNMGLGTEAAREEERPTDDLEEFLRAFEEWATSTLAYYGTDPAEIIVVKKTPRPPKRTGPVNKANYSANRPARRARSSCYRRRH